MSHDLNAQTSSTSAARVLQGLWKVSVPAGPSISCLLRSTNTVEVSDEEHVGLICCIFGYTLYRSVGHRMLRKCRTLSKSPPVRVSKVDSTTIISIWRSRMAIVLTPRPESLECSLVPHAGVYREHTMPTKRHCRIAEGRSCQEPLLHAIRP